MKTVDLLKQLSARFPSIAFSASRQIDDYYRWDGDGDAPEDMSAYDVTVSASAVICGNLTTCETHVGGSYYEDNEPIGDIHGYLPQMAEESVSQLADKAKDCAPFIRAEALSASKWLKGEIRRRYDEQMQSKAEGRA